MDYEKAYKEALEKIREGLQPLPDGAKISGVTRAFLEEVFPELKESEGEKVRKWLIKYFNKADFNGMLEYVNGIKSEDIIAWLEKQGASIDVDSILNKVGIKSAYKDGNAWCILFGDNIQDGICGFGNTKEEALIEFLKELLEKQGEQKPSDKVEPIFNEGDFVVSKITNTTYQIESVVLNVTNNKYGYDLTNGGYIASIETNIYHLWTIKDAKDGDVLVDDLGNICIYQEPSTKLMYHSHCYGNYDYFVDRGGSHEVEGTCPATKEQRDTLFAKMKEAGYEWLEETHELKEIEQKPTWSEEDEEILKNLIDYFSLDDGLRLPTEETVDWLKSLKERLS